jgi:hypothetical protein
MSVTKPKPKPPRGPRPGITALTDPGLQAMLTETWAKTRETIETGAASGGLAEAIGADNVAVLLAFVREHEDVARTLYHSGFMVALAFSATGAMTFAVQAESGGCPIHGPGGCHEVHRTVGRA